MASPEGIYEDDSFQHIDEHLNVRAAPRFFLLRAQQRVHRRTHRPENVVQDVAMIFAEMMQLTEQYPDDRQTLIH
jgi:hypothetical protein